VGVAYWWWTTVATQKYFGATGGQLSVLTIGHCPVRFCPLPLLGPPLLSRSRLVLVYVAFSDSYQALVLDSLKPKSSGQGRKSHWLAICRLPHSPFLPAWLVLGVAARAAWIVGRTHRVSFFAKDIFYVHSLDGTLAPFLAGFSVAVA